MTDKIVVISTCSSADEGARIGRQLVEKRLAACVNIVPGARSLYWWQGAIEDSEEVILLIKSRRELLPKLSEALHAIHSYTTPEVVALQIVDGSQAYLEWVEAETSVSS